MISSCAVLSRGNIVAVSTRSHRALGPILEFRVVWLPGCSLDYLSPFKENEDNLIASLVEVAKASEFQLAFAYLVTMCVGYCDLDKSLLSRLILSLLIQLQMIMLLLIL